jgi:hypothetical protein
MSNEKMSADEVLAVSVIENALRATKENAEAGGMHGWSHCTITGKLFEAVSGGTAWRVDGVMKSFVEVMYESGLLVKANTFADLIAERDALREDAERYRWLRDLPEGSPHEQIGNFPGCDWDKAIDDAREDERNADKS